MYRKMNIRRLLLLVVILLLVVGGLTLKDYFKGDRSFRTMVMTVDTSKVNSIRISSPIPNLNTVKLYLDHEQWKVSENNKIFNADPAIIKNLITDLSQLKIESLAGTGNTTWTEFQVNDSAAIKVSIEEKGKKKNKILFIGKFTYQQPSNPYDRQGRLSTYVRLAGENETYSVQGFLRMNFTPDINNYRNKFLLKSSSELFSKLSFQYPGDSSFVMVKDNKKWLIDGVPVDSMKSENYFTDVERLNCNDLADTVKHNIVPAFVLKIEGSTLGSPIVMSAFKASSGNGYVVQSSYNTEALFNGTSNNLISRIFKGKKQFFK